MIFNEKLFGLLKNLNVLFLKNNLEKLILDYLKILVL